METIAQVLLIRPDGALVLVHEGHGTEGDLIGGLVEVGDELELPHWVAARAVNEQSSLQLGGHDLVFWRRYPTGYLPEDPTVYVFTLHRVNVQNPAPSDTMRLVTVHNRNDAAKLNLSPLMRRIVNDYFHELHRVHQHRRATRPVDSLQASTASAPAVG